MITKFIRRLLGARKSPTEGEKGRARAIKPARVGPEVHGIDPKLVSSNAIRVTKTLQEAGHLAFIVGGAVRDLMLGVKPKDFDVATDATPEQVQGAFRRARIIGRRFRLVHVMFGNDTIEVSTFRSNQPADAETDVHGRVVRDNVFGSQEDDATRRDFTVNALYYDPATQSVIDYHHGVKDIRSKTLRIIGDPVRRFTEDPVRMLRAVRLAGKLGFEIEAATRAPIAKLAPLMQNVPAARLFDEMLKLLLSGHALECLRRLRAEGLHHGLLPLLDVVFEQPLGERFVTLALQSTDERIRLGKPTSPSFLFSCLLWHEVLKAWEENKASGEYPIPALGRAMDRVLDNQTESLAIQRRFVADMREIWGLQPRLERRTGRSPHRLLEHLRFRAGYDFLLLRCEAGECDAELGQWWTNFIAADGPGREALQTLPASQSAPGAAKRKRRRRKRPADAGTESGERSPGADPHSDAAEAKPRRAKAGADTDGEA
ncbi:MAG: polynucleotide adenylyltransferase PcnB [Burkholderiaceae bacterium]|jgi:poly(A) polymerase